MYSRWLYMEARRGPAPTPKISARILKTLNPRNLKFQDFRDFK